MAKSAEEKPAVEAGGEDGSATVIVYHTSADEAARLAELLRRVGQAARLARLRAELTALRAKLEAAPAAGTTRRRGEGDGAEL